MDEKAMYQTEIFMIVWFILHYSYRTFLKLKARLLFSLWT